MLDILKKYQSIQHQRRRLNVIFGNGLRQLGVREENNPVKGRARSLFIPDRNYSLTKYLADAEADPGEFCRAGQTA
jgi:hypothetical protein